MHENAVEHNYPYSYLFSGKPSAWGSYMEKSLESYGFKHEELEQRK